MADVHYRTCHLCEAMCGLALTVEGDRITRIVGDAEDPFSRGHICPKAYGLKDIHEDPDRLNTPVRRVGERWEPLSWDEAFDLVASEIGRLQADHGAHSVATYTGNPAAHNYGSLLHGQLLHMALRTPNNFSATSLDQLPHMLAAYLMLGHQLRLPIPDIDRTRFMVLVGANPAVSNGSLMSAGDVKAALRGVRDRGGRVVVVDPRRTETDRLADEHIFIRPGTDAAFLAALASHILARHGARLGALAEHCDGLDTLTSALAPFTPDRVAPATGIAPQTIRRLADQLVEQTEAVVYGRVGVCTQPFGGLGGWLLNVVNAVSGHLDRPGGLMFPTPAIDLADLAGRLGRGGSYDRRRSRVKGWPEFGGEFPTPTLADEILTPGEGRIRGLVTSAGNPVLSSPGGPRLADALSKLDFMVSIDIYVNETTRHAHVILPPTFGVEHDHYDLVFHALAVRNSAKYSPALFKRRPEQRHDWEIYAALARRVLAKHSARSSLRASASTAERRRVMDRIRAPAVNGVLRALERFEPARVIDLMLRLGPYRLSLRQLRKSPHGVDLGPMRSRLPGVLPSPKRIQLAPEPFVADLPRLAARLDQPQDKLTLIGRRNLRSNNSWMHNSRRLVKGKPTCTLMMHPDDARARNLQHEQPVRVRTEAGAVIVPLEISDGMMPGVVSLPHGWGHGQDGVQLRVAAAHPGASSNDVIRPQVDPLSGTARLNDVPVDVTAA